MRIDYSELDEFVADCTVSARNLLESQQPANETAEAVAAVARGKAPVLSGALAGSIRAGGNVVTAGEGLQYGAVQEFGWPGHNIEGQHFVWGAIAQVKPEEKIWDGLTKLLRRAFPGLPY